MAEIRVLDKHTACLLYTSLQNIQTALVDDPPANMKDGGAIRAGFNSEVDEPVSYTHLMMNTSHIKALSNKERSRHHERKKTG